MINSFEYKGYKGSIEYCKDDEILFGHVIGVDNHIIGYHGDDIKSLRVGFESMVDDYLEVCRANGLEAPKPLYAEAITVELPQDAYDKLLSVSTRLNADITKTLSKAITVLEVASL